MRTRNLIFLIVGTILAAALASSFKKPEYSKVKLDEWRGNPPNGKTGAPGEGLCTDCHSGSAVAADGFVTFDFSGGDTYIPGQVYTINMELSSPNVRNGFQVVALSGGLNSGEFQNINPTFTSIQNFNGKKYINQTSAGSDLSVWSFDWQAPNEQGETTFYYTVNKTNGNGNTVGDQIFIGQFSVASEGVGIGQFNLTPDIRMVQEEGAVTFSISKWGLQNERPHVSIINMQGMDVSGKIELMETGEEFSGSVFTESLPTGVYILQVFDGNKPYVYRFAL